MRGDKSAIKWCLQTTNVPGALCPCPCMPCMTVTWHSPALSLADRQGSAASDWSAPVQMQILYQLSHNSPYELCNWIGVMPQGAVRFKIIRKCSSKINFVMISVQLRSQRCICAEPRSKLRLGKSNSFTGAFKWTSPLQSLSVDMWKSEWEDVITWWLSYWDDGNRSCGALDSDWSLWGYHYMSSHSSCCLTCGHKPQNQR